MYIYIHINIHIYIYTYIYIYVCVRVNIVPGQKDCFNFQGKVLKLVGMNRQNPRRLIDEYTKEVRVHVCVYIYLKLVGWTEEGCVCIYTPRKPSCIYSLIFMLDGLNRQNPRRLMNAYTEEVLEYINTFIYIHIYM